MGRRLGSETDGALPGDSAAWPGPSRGMSGRPGQMNREGSQTRRSGWFEAGLCEVLPPWAEPLGRGHLLLIGAARTAGAQGWSACFPEGRGSGWEIHSEKHLKPGNEGDRAVSIMSSPRPNRADVSASSDESSTAHWSHAGCALSQAGDLCSHVRVDGDTPFRVPRTMTPT